MILLIGKTVLNKNNMKHICDIINCHFINKNVNLKILRESTSILNLQYDANPIKYSNSRLELIRHDYEGLYLIQYKPEFSISEILKKQQVFLDSSKAYNTASPIGVIDDYMELMLKRLEKYEKEMDRTIGLINLKLFKQFTINYNNSKVISMTYDDELLIELSDKNI